MQLSTAYCVGVTLVVCWVFVKKLDPGPLFHSCGCLFGGENAIDYSNVHVFHCEWLQIMENFPGCHLEPCNTKVGGNKTNTKVGKHCKKLTWLNFFCIWLWKLDAWMAFNATGWKKCLHKFQAKIIGKDHFWGQFSTKYKKRSFFDFLHFFPCRQHPNMDMCGICSKVRE